MEFKGQITHVGELENLISKTGTPYSRRSVTLSTVEQHPQTAVFSLSGITAQNFSGSVGQIATVHFDLHAFHSQGGKTFNNLDAWRIEI